MTEVLWKIDLVINQSTSLTTKSIILYTFKKISIIEQEQAIAGFILGKLMDKEDHMGLEEECLKIFLVTSMRASFKTAKDMEKLDTTKTFMVLSAQKAILSLRVTIKEVKFTTFERY